MQDLEVSGFQILPNEVAIALSPTEIVEFCRRWHVQKFYLLGSVLRDDFRPDSDVDVMVQFFPEAPWGFEIATMKRQLEQLFGRKVDLLTKASVEESHNWMRRQEILDSAKLVYVAG